jgi:hypothetical protein
MTRRTVTLVLAAHLVITWAAVVLRLDFFPLTWAPMYSVCDEGEELRARIVDHAVLEDGILATRRDGRTERVTMDALNMPRWNFWRFVYERAFGDGPNKLNHENADPGAVQRFLVGAGPTGPIHRAHWEWRLLRSTNLTLGRRPDDPSFIVALEASATEAYFLRPDLDRWRTVEHRVVLRWDDAWSLRVDGEPR